MNTASVMSDRGISSAQLLILKRKLHIILGAGEYVTLLDSSVQRLQWLRVCAHQKTGG
jgi:hypothetical protein